MKQVLLGWFEVTITEITERYMAIISTSRPETRHVVVSEMIQDANVAGMNNVTVEIESETNLRWDWNNLTGHDT